VDPRVPNNPFTFLADWKPYLHKGLSLSTLLTIVSVDLLSSTGRTQAFSLGEAFFDHYGFSLLNQSHVYKIEHGGNFTSLFAHADQNRVEETARWFAMGFWGINSSDNVMFHGIPENLCTFRSRVPDV